MVLYLSPAYLPMTNDQWPMTNDQWPFLTLFFFPLPKKEPKKATAKEHLTGVRSVPANGI